MGGALSLCLIILFFLALCSPYSSLASYNLREGSSLSVENPADVLTSPKGIFSAGFFRVGHNAYCFAIWFTEPNSWSRNLTVVWMANREQPVNGRRSKLTLTKSSNLVLTDAGQSTVWSSDTASNSTSQLQLLDTGNLVVITQKRVVLWQSFASPTDTLLPGQTLTRNTKLVSSRSQTNYSSGFYKLFYDNDNVLRLLYDGPQISSIYWPDPWLLPGDAGRSIFNDSRTAVLDSFGNFSSSDSFMVLASDYGVKIQRRLTIEADGNLRLYSRKQGKQSTWAVAWEAVLQPCKIHGICGTNSLCTYVTEFGRKCSCLPGNKMINRTDWTQGCEPDFELPCSVSTANHSGFVHLPRVEFYGYDYRIYWNYTLERCKSKCLELCDSCLGFHYKFDKGGGLYNCYAKLQLRNGYRTPGFEGDIYLKLPNSVISSLHSAQNDSNLDCSSGNLTLSLDRKYERRHVSGLIKFMLWFACGVGGLEIFIILMVWLFVIRNHENSGLDNIQAGYILAATGFRKFSYLELKKATKGFSLEVGRGAGGIVYKAILSDNRVAAVKKLTDTNQGEVEFLAEVSIIGRLNHMNLIEMWGYCAEGKHRLLVYEYMEHGSLAENLASNALDWKRRFEIAVGTARGLAYLHEECLEWVLHCDVKPQNILLGSNYQPKVADFGLSKLLNRGELGDYSSFSRIRGTRGYMAPEWVYNLPITSKVDVYSYGIVVLEMLTRNDPTRGVFDGEGGEVRPKMLVAWVREKMSACALLSEQWIDEIIDPMMEGKYNLREAQILIKVALKCVEEDKDARPTMSQVVEMLLSHENEN
ncbi:S-receptor-like serine/threonine-protein kinase [Trema orientale]|uniref:Receptor-like serine/threonine-protein kinase n=1 Tax=Trema orientale TaxID=63057 RepID=A0A2P5EGL5_TREOI|nr:S-receptor-like serine/threonine-protein kinase [Trema orientale]